MKRIVDYHLVQWKKSQNRRPLLIRGARQIGKTYAVRALGQKFESFIEINLESNKKARSLFSQDLDPKRILQSLSILTEKEIKAGKTLLFLDEIQTVPEAITALRYFYEEIPSLHVIGAGSLLDFAIEQVGVPVGRVEFLHMYPMSFLEFLKALDKRQLIKSILTHPLEEAQVEVIHETFLQLLAVYLTIGGMPQIVNSWRERSNLQECTDLKQNLVDAYKYDFVKYGKNHQMKYLDLLFSQVPYQFGKKFKYSAIGDFRKRELEPCLQLLTTSGVLHKVLHSDAQGLPLGAHAEFNIFKMLFIDIALSQFMLDLKQGSWMLNPLEEFANKGDLVEAFIGQELLAYSNPKKQAQLYFWKREARGSSAEIDYIIQLGKNVIPVEVKSGKGNSMKSMQVFLESHPKTPYGIRLSTHNYSLHKKIHSYPLYALAKVLTEDSSDKESFLFLTETS